MSFHDWIKSNQNKNKDLKKLFGIAQKNLDVWHSIASLEDAKAAIESDAGLKAADKTKIVENIDAVWLEYSNNRGKYVNVAHDSKKHILWEFLTNNNAAIAICAFCLVLLFVLIWAIVNPSFLSSLGDPRKARGLITFFFALGTVGVAIVLTAAAFSISADDRELMRERFDMGKQVLTALIGIFGTILGFYFVRLEKRLSH